MTARLSDGPIDATQGDTPPRYWPVPTLAAALAVSERSLWRAIAAHDPSLDVVRIGKTVRVRLAEKPGIGTRCQ